MISNRGMARAGAAMAACGTAALLALTGCSSGSSSSSATGGTTAAGDATVSAAALPFSSAPAHTLSTPTRLGPYTRDPSMEKAMDFKGACSPLGSSLCMLPCWFCSCESLMIKTTLRVLHPLDVSSRWGRQENQWSVSKGARCPLRSARPSPRVVARSRAIHQG
jgi:hypothetical protein